jgi:ribonucleoside-triphosphate reductase
MFQIDQPFHLDQQFLQELREKPVPWGGGLLSQATYFRTYSREREGRQEQFADTIQRCIEGCLSIRKTWYKLIGQHWDEPAMQRFGQYMATTAFQMKWLPPGRSLFALGTGYPETRGNAALNNCGFVMCNRLSEAAAWLMDHLMLGVGIGFRISEWGHRLDKPEGEPVIYQAPDSREGWVEATRLLVNSYEMDEDFEGNWKRPVVFDYTLVRPRGSRINGFGGTASGPEPMREMHEKIRELMNRACDQVHDPNWPHQTGEATAELTADIMNLIGVCVVAGNVRRSAEIAIGSSDDHEFLHLKDYGTWDDSQQQWKTQGPGFNRRGWGHMSNNSVWISEDRHFEAIPELVGILLDRGEPGFINAINIRNRGRYTDKVGNGIPWLRYDEAIGMNPCGEIPLEDRELCNLVEVFPTRCTSMQEWLSIIDCATFFASTIALLPSHDPTTNAVVARNRRIGVSVSGVADWIDAVPFSKVHRWLDNGYERVRSYNRQLAADAGVPESIRVTTVKPSGSVSLLPWVSPGMHHPVKSRFIRRINVSASDPVAERLIAAGVPWEPNDADINTLVFEFPMESANRGRTRSVDRVPFAEQCALASFMARVWADNSVSFTGTINQSDLAHAERVITMTLPTIKSMSAIVNQETQKQYRQLPYEAISVEEYNRRNNAIQPVDWSGFRGSDGQDPRYCDAEVCEVPWLST